MKVQRCRAVVPWAIAATAVAVTALAGDGRRNSQRPRCRRGTPSAVEQDRRGHGRRLGRVPGRGRDLHGLRVDGRLRRHVALQGGYEPLLPAFSRLKKASPDAASSRPPTGRSPLLPRRRRRRSTPPLRRARSRRSRTAQAEGGRDRIGLVAATRSSAPGPGDGLMTPIARHRPSRLSRPAQGCGG